MCDPLRQGVSALEERQKEIDLVNHPSLADSDERNGKRDRSPDDDNDSKRGRRSMLKAVPTKAASS